MSNTADAIHSECMKVLDDFMAALNDHDSNRMDSTMHFPHLRLADGKFKVYQAPGSNPMDLFTKLKNEDDWSFSRWDRRKLIQFNDRKAHFQLSYTRFRTDGSVIGSYDSLYILTFQDERWGIQARSSFGP